MNEPPKGRPGKLRAAAARSWTLKAWRGLLFDLGLAALAAVVAHAFGWTDLAQVAVAGIAGLVVAPVLEISWRLLRGPVAENRELRERIGHLEEQLDTEEKERREREAIRDRLLAVHATATEQLQKTAKVWEPNHFRDWRAARDECMLEVKDCVGPVVYARLTEQDHAPRPPERWERQFQTEWKEYSDFVHGLLQVIEVYYGDR